MKTKLLLSFCYFHYPCFLWYLCMLLYAPSILVSINCTRHSLISVPGLVLSRTLDNARLYENFYVNMRTCMISRYMQLYRLILVGSAISLSDSVFPRCSKMCSGWHWLQSFLHIFQIFISYCLMLAFMTYNGWVCIAICVGGGLGHLLFGWMRRHYSATQSEHCH